MGAGSTGGGGLGVQDNHPGGVLLTFSVKGASSRERAGGSGGGGGGGGSENPSPSDLDIPKG